MGGGIGRIEMLKTTNILCLVGGGKKPKFSLNKIIIWDDNEYKIIGELRFNDPILNTKIKMDRIIGITEKKIYVFNINTLDLIEMYETFENINGIHALSSGDMVSILAFPFQSKGKIKIVNFLSSFKPPLISAHDSKIACLSINKEGTLLATASDKGTLIRIFFVQNGNLILELRRGAKNAEINFIIFDDNNKYIGCTSGMGTVHIFSIVDALKNINEYNFVDNDDEPKNQKGFLHKLGGILKIKSLDSEYSFAKFRIPERKSIMCFISDNSFICLTCEGKYYLASFDPKINGECVKLQEFNITNKINMAKK